MCLAMPGRILSTRVDETGLEQARVDFGGVVKEACLACVPEAKPGDYVIVHVGFAISRLDPEEARRSLALFAELGS